jgi:hypothetical protein
MAMMAAQMVMAVVSRPMVSMRAAHRLGRRRGDTNGDQTCGYDGGNTERGGAANDDPNFKIHA